MTSSSGRIPERAASSPPRFPVEQRILGLAIVHEIEQLVEGGRDLRVGFVAMKRVRTKWVDHWLHLYSLELLLPPQLANQSPEVLHASLLCPVWNEIGNQDSASKGLYISFNQKCSEILVFKRPAFWENEAVSEKNISMDWFGSPKVEYIQHDLFTMVHGIFYLVYVWTDMSWVCNKIRLTLARPICLRWKI